MPTTRRSLLTAIFGFLGAAVALPASARIIKQQPMPSLGAGDFSEALRTALAGQEWTPSERVMFDIPEMAENGAIVPVTVASSLPEVDRILIFAERNPGPLLASFDLEPGTDPWVSVRVKLNDSGPVLAVIRSQGRFFGTLKTIKVMKGGCG